jgi:hypothetical protein
LDRAVLAYLSAALLVEGDVAVAITFAFERRIAPDLRKGHLLLALLYL